MMATTLNTLKEIRDISKEKLNNEKKLIKLLEERSQVSFLYENEDISQKKSQKKSEKNGRKSFKKVQEKSTIKKLGTSLLEERI